MIRVSNNPSIDTVIKLVTVAVAMFAFVFVVMVPLYNVLCDALGINGKTSGEVYTAAQAGVDESREITIQFVATNNDGMPWEFRPSNTMMRVNPGASNDTVFLARNPMPQAMVAQAIPSVSPSRAAEYFHKTECFCFNQQPLDGRSSAEMPLQFIIDRELPRDIKTITLSYTLFDVTDMAQGAVAAR
ncbi:cytochrome c oxidase assembly protein [Congregibacter litoralis]|uniref:Cytochrome c oxidase assembly protein CtaG n=1 Tax=Congregibacter litoralis KT71 TaxID=314285 RepID=A4A923_9GAMM|nr:cytochrome c oxidase assembly protein [Congregibacter litoralis]EAQ97565.1 Cytochrome oxidase assembly factor [Congregibacter litoralis KT71]